MAIGRQAARPGNGCGTAIFRRAPPKGAHIVYGTTARFASRSKIAAPPTSSASLQPCALLRVLVRSACRLVIATKAAMGAADPAKGPRAMTTDHDDTEFEPPHDSSPTDHLLGELQLYGHRPFQDEPDPRPLPEGKAIAGAIADIFDALVATLNDTRLEPDLEDLLWSTVNLFH